MIRKLFLFSLLAVLSSSLFALPPSIGTSKGSKTAAPSFKEDNSSSSHGFKTKKKRKLFQGLMQSLRRNKDKRSSVVKECDRILLHSGQGKVTEVGISTISYKKCDWEDGPLYKVDRNSVKQIIYANGIEEKIEPEKTRPQAQAHAQTPNNYNPKERGVNNLSITAFVFALASIIFPFFIPVAIILSAIALARGKRFNVKRGRKLAVAALVISLLIVAVYIGLLALLIGGTI